MKAGVKSERPTNTMDTVMKRHQGELRVFEVPLLLYIWQQGDGGTPRNIKGQP